MTGRISKSDNTAFAALLTQKEVTLDPVCVKCKDECSFFLQYCPGTEKWTCESCNEARRIADEKYAKAHNGVGGRFNERRKAEEVTCKTCPNLSDICGYHYGCESKRMEELHVRKALADVGQHTIHKEWRIPDENGI